MLPVYDAIDGHGPDVVFLHGWGLHGGVFARVAATLVDRYTVHCLDLPGHGASPAQPGMSIEQAAAAVAEPFPLPVHLVGWSLGGLLAQYWAAQWPDTVRSLTLISTTPRFVIDAGWPHGMGRDRLAATAYRLDMDFDQTLRQFLALQTLGAPDARQTLQALSAMLFAHGRPKGLHDGLNWLLDGDARALAAQINCPTILCYGERDRLTPPGALEWLAEHLPDARRYPFAQASHAPFLSHEETFCRILRSHLQDND